MTRYDRRTWVLAACLSAIAGYVDALGFITLGGYFVSFMSGNSTRMAVGLAEGFRSSLLPFALIASFVLGVILGSLAGRKAGKLHRPVVLGAVSALLVSAAIFHALGQEVPTIIFMVIAMGAENAVFERDGEVSIGLTYMTGALVKLGQNITSALLGGSRFGWMPYLLLWSGLVTGAVAGASVYPFTGLSGLWLPALATALLAVLAGRLGSGDRPLDSQDGR